MVSHTSKLHGRVWEFMLEKPKYENINVAPMQFIIYICYVIRIVIVVSEIGSYEVSVVRHYTAWIEWKRDLYTCLFSALWSENVVLLVSIYMELASAMISEHNHRLKSCTSDSHFSPASFLNEKPIPVDCDNVDVEKLKMPFFFLNHTHLHITIPIHKNAEKRRHAHAQIATTRRHE